MHTLTVESALGKQLNAMAEQVVVCDEGGKVLGFFSPIPNHPAVGDLQFEPPLSIEETERLRRQNRTGKPLQEILNRHGL